MVQKIADAYRLWHGVLPHLPRLSRYTFGARIDAYFLDIIESIVRAAYARRELKTDMVVRASGALDLLKFFLHLAWDMKILDTKKYLEISAPLTDVGKMLGGWRKQLATEPPAA